MKKASIFLLLFICCTPHYARFEIPLANSDSRSESRKKDDSLLVISQIKKHGTIREASKYNLTWGWTYLNSTSIGWSIPFYQATMNPMKIYNAMQFFYNAWLIDSLNSESYWGISIIAASKEKKYVYAEKLMEKAISIDSSNVNIWFDLAVSNMDLLNNVQGLDSSQINIYQNNAIKGFQRIINSNADSTIKLNATKFLKQLNNK